MSKLKKYSDYVKEQDQHRIESEKDIAIRKEIDELHNDEIELGTDIETDDELSEGDLESLKTANERILNEGAVKGLLFEIKDILKNMVSKNGLVVPENISKSDIDELLYLTSEEIIGVVRDSLMTNEDVGGDDIPNILIDQEEARRFKETKKTLDGKSKEVYDTTSEVEKNLEKEDVEEIQHPYEGSEESSNVVEINDFKIEESDFTIYPEGGDFKLMKESLGEETNYQSLRSYLKESFPGWERHTSDILDVWKLIK